MAKSTLRYNMIVDLKSSMAEDLETKTQDIPAATDSLDKGLFFQFFHWYFVLAPKDILSIWAGYLQANLHYFAIILLLRTLFAPWHRDLEGYGRGFDFGRYFRVFTMNMVSRGVGFVVRLVVVLVGLSAEVLILAAGLVFLIFWIVAPVILTIMLIKGLSMIL